MIDNQGPSCDDYHLEIFDLRVVEFHKRCIHRDMIYRCSSAAERLKHRLLPFLLLPQGNGPFYE